ncbi:hypothetical protein GCU67_20670 [Modestobacter muralis]|uniref:Type IV secretion system protein n=1 Tax=Modestobacter muralis TaxID=1608614 RepID=A0A6P0F0Y4_9ACTN|nr:hypothetical protein [Modestobacter muralis]NEK96559.1 hypothetical protein [Modestobacter muralis]NEN53459.1 hypothetical protein [Modestobacter muralis]
MSAVRAAADRVAAAARSLTWPFRTPMRLMTLAWLVALTLVGSANNALAAVNDGGLFIGPDLGNAGGLTLFERFDVSAFSYPVDTDSDHDGLESQVWNVANAVAGFITWLGLSILRGALVALQWMLNLDLYADQSAAVDAAMSQLNTGVFLPLLVISLGIGVVVAFTRGRTTGGGSFVGDMIWLVAASVLAITFVAGPSRVLDTFDDARSSLADASTTAYSAAAGVTNSSTGYPTPNTGNDPDGAVRQLTDSLWNVYGVSGWCYTAWKSVDSCEVVGQSYLENPDAEDGESAWGTARAQLADDGDVDPFGDDTPWVRGQDPGRIGAALMLGALSIGAGMALLAMTVFGLMALIGLIILIFLGVFFLATWMIPGRPRQIGVRWLESLLGTFLQTLIITTILGAVMVVGAIFNSASATYGIFMVAVFNGTALILGLRYRGQIEQMLGFGTSATGTSLVSGYLAARAVTSGSRLGRRALGGAARAGARGAAAAPEAIGSAASSTAKGVRRAAAAPGAVRRGAQRVLPMRMGHLGSRPAPVPGSAPATSGTTTAPVATAAPVATGPTPATPATGRPAASSRPGPASGAVPASSSGSAPAATSGPGSRTATPSTAAPAASAPAATVGAAGASTARPAGSSRPTGRRGGGTPGTGAGRGGAAAAGAGRGGGQRRQGAGRPGGASAAPVGAGSPRPTANPSSPGGNRTGDAPQRAAGRSGGGTGSTRYTAAPQGTGGRAGGASRGTPAGGTGSSRNTPSGGGGSTAASVKSTNKGSGGGSSSSSTGTRRSAGTPQAPSGKSTARPSRSDASGASAAAPASSTQRNPGPRRQYRMAPLRKGPEQ